MKVKGSNKLHLKLKRNKKQEIGKPKAIYYKTKFKVTYIIWKKNCQINLLSFIMRT